MAITRKQKEEIVDELREDFRNSKIVIAVSFSGLTVQMAQELRKALRDADSKYIVAKKTLVARVLDELGYDGDRPDLEGSLALAFGKDDAVATTQALHTFAKEHGEEITLLGGVFENKYIGGETVLMLASIPPRPVLLGMFVNVINSPVQGFVGVLNNTINRLTTVLHNIADNK